MEEDIKVLAYQLGRSPRSLIEIKRRCSNKYPQVVVTHPILEKEEQVNIFPTTFWLTCPELKYMIDKLENQGLIEQLQEKMTKDQQFANEIEKAHQEYADYRLDLIETDKLTDIKNNYTGQYRVLKESGVGGILEFSGIKCLHTHYADYLARGKNPIGKLVFDYLNKEFGQKAKLKNCRKCGEALKDESSSN